VGRTPKCGAFGQGSPFGTDPFGGQGGSGGSGGQTAPTDPFGFGGGTNDPSLQQMLQWLNQFLNNGSQQQPTQPAQPGTNGSGQ
jgi:hypothetical protein